MTRSYLWIAGTLIFAGILLLISPFHAINPGVLSKGHEKLQNDCMSCHTLMQGAVTEKCIACHEQNEIGKLSASDTHPAKENKRAILLHKNIKEIDCVTCHLEHTGESKNLAVKKFSHDIIGNGVKEKCSACHDYQKPVNDFHKEAKAECSGCHSTAKWKNAKFDHKLVGATKDNCNNCHEKNRPSDDLHKSLSPKESCFVCHSVDRWKPASFEHSKYFVFDKHHSATCTNCHETGKNFKTWTCYNCHEHSEARISRKHLKEGITDFTNCVKCHRSGDKEGLEGGESKDKERESKKRGRHPKERDDD